MREEIKEVMAGVFGVTAVEIPNDASTENFPAWDSLKHLELMLALEMALGVHISTEAMLGLRSLPEIEAHVAGQRAP